MSEQIEKQIREKSAERNFMVATLAVISAIPSAIVIGVISVKTLPLAFQGVLQIFTFAVHGIVGVIGISNIPRSKIFERPEETHSCTYVLVLMCAILFSLVGVYGIMQILLVIAGSFFGLTGTFNFGLQS